MGYDWNFSSVVTVDNLWVLFQGFGITLTITFVSIVVGTILGFCWGVGAIAGSEKSAVWSDPFRHQDPRSHILGSIRRRFLTQLIDLVRSIPLLLFIFLAFYGVPQLVDFLFNSWAGAIGLNWEPTPLQTVLVAFSINLGAFIADLVRAGLASFSTHRMQSGLSVGIPRNTLIRHVVIPDLLREIYPALSNLYITIFKMSTLASSVAIYEILHSGNVIIQKTYRPLEVYSVIAAFFIMAAMLIVFVQKFIESRSVFRKRT